MQVVLQLTRDCNLACRYCYQTHRKGRGMPPEIVEGTVRWLLDTGHTHLPLTYFGGEPLLERRTIEATLPELSRWGHGRRGLESAFF